MLDAGHPLVRFGTRDCCWFAFSPSPVSPEERRVTRFAFIPGSLNLEAEKIYEHACIRRNSQIQAHSPVFPCHPSGLACSCSRSSGNLLLPVQVLSKLLSVWRRPCTFQCEQR